MANKKFNVFYLTNFLKIIALVMGVLVIAFAFMETVIYKHEILGTSQYTGIQAIFGYTEKVTSTISVTYLNFSFLNLLAYILPLTGAVLMLLKNKYVNFAGAILTIIGSVFLFLVPTFVVAAFDTSYLTSVLGIGGILSIIAAIIGCLCCCATVYLNRK